MNTPQQHATRRSLLMRIHTHMSNLGLRKIKLQQRTFGKITVGPSPRAGKVWLAHAEGEGMDVPQEKLAAAMKNVPEAQLPAVLEQFFADNF